MRRRVVLALTLLAGLLALVPPAAADHPVPSFGGGVPASSTVNSGGVEGVEWELVTSFPTGNPHTDLDYFTSGGETYAAVGTLAAGANAGGVTILQLTEGGEVSPSYVTSHPSASCVTDPTSALGLQHDVEATPKGDVLFNTGAWGDLAVQEDAQLVLDATDAEGRCHDNGPVGQAVAGAPRGGLEIIDVTDPANPVEIGLTSNIGEAHTVNVDPSRPHIAYAVSSDAVTVAPDVEVRNAQGVVTKEADCDGDGDTEELIRLNECTASGERFDLDGFEVVDLSSCMNFPEGTSVEDKRASCQPQVYRFRYPSPDVTLGHTNPTQVHGCHELELYPDDTLTCGGGDATTLWDISGLFDDNGTPDDRTDDTVNGTPLPCRRRPSTSNPLFTTGAMVVDCVNGGTDEAPIDLSVAAWLDAGAPSAEGIALRGTAYHQGRETTTGAAMPAQPSTEDIDFAHEAELTHSGRFVLSTDERGGGVAPPGASCAPGVDNPTGNGGVHAFAVDRLFEERPVPVTTAEASTFPAEVAWSAYARTSDGAKSIFRAPIRTQPQATICTAHVFQQIPGQNRIVMGWYSQGTRVIDYVENPDGTLDFTEIGYFIPENANTWTSQVFDVQENEDGSFTYTGATGDFNLGEGRSAIDIYRFTAPRPLQMADEVLPQVERVAGEGPIGTAVAVSQRTQPDGADAVVLGRVDVYADNLAGGPLAASLGAPLLYTETGALPEATRAEIERLGATRAVVLGGTAAVSEAVADELRAMDLEVDRLGGANRFDTARLVALELGSATGEVFIAEGESSDPARGFPDPIAVAAYAGQRRDPVLLVNRDRLPSETVAALEDVGATEAAVVGGAAAVSAAVEQEVVAAGASTRRIAGATRYETSLAVLEEALATGAASGSTLWLATGQDWRDALAAGPAAAAAGDAFATIDGQGGADTRDRVLAAVGDDLELVRIVGDESSVSTATEEAIRAAVAAEAAPTAARTAGVGLPTGDVAVAVGAAALLLAAGAATRRRRLGSVVD